MAIDAGVWDGFEVVSTPMEAVRENGTYNVLIQFDYYNTEHAKAEEEILSNTVLEDEVDEWPKPKQIHTFYLVRHWPYDDPKIKAKLIQTNRDIQKSNKARFQIIDDLKVKRAERSKLFAQMDFLQSEHDKYNATFGEKRKEIEPLQRDLSKLRNGDSGHQGGANLCSSEKQLDQLVCINLDNKLLNFFTKKKLLNSDMQYWIQQESIQLFEEKRLLKEIKQLEGTWQKVIVDSVMRAKDQESVGQKQAIQEPVKLLNVNLNEIKKEHQALTTAINNLGEKLKANKLEIDSLEAKLNVETEKREEHYYTIRELRRQRDERNGIYYRSRSIMSRARELAANKNIRDLDEHCHNEVESFMKLWNSDKAFRGDYEKRILPSLNFRQLSRDGRIRDPNEKLLCELEVPRILSEPEILVQTNLQNPKEDSGLASHRDTPLARTKNGEEETSNNVKEFMSSSEHSEDVDSRSSETSHEDSSHQDKIDELEAFFEDSSHRDEIDEKQYETDNNLLKAQKREEEMAKARQAMWRKQKRREKAAVKAAVRAQKEAEKKLKEREKKAKKKKSAASCQADSEETQEASEPEKVNYKALSRERGRVSRKKWARYRRQTRGSEAISRALSRNRRATSYWLWAASAAVGAALVPLVFAFFNAF